MSDNVTYPTDHGQVAWDNFLAQHEVKINTENFVKSFYPPLNLLDTALYQMYADRWIETAYGEQLDLIGSIVGIGRTVSHAVYLAFFGFFTQFSGRAFGVARLRRQGERWAESAVLDDEKYRNLIQLKIAMNNGHGTADEISSAVDLGLGISGTYVNDTGNASFQIVIADPTMASDDVRLQLLDEVVLKPAGVKMTIGFAAATMWDLNHSIWDGGHSPWDRDAR